MYSDHPGGSNKDRKGFTQSNCIATNHVVTKLNEPALRGLGFTLHVVAVQRRQLGLVETLRGAGAPAALLSAAMSLQRPASTTTKRITKHQHD